MVDLEVKAPVLVPDGVDEVHRIIRDGIPYNWHVTVSILLNTLKASCRVDNKVTIVITLDGRTHDGTQGLALNGGIGTPGQITPFGQ